MKMKSLTKRQKTTLKRHKKHHTAKHMTAMRKAMRKGKTFCMVYRFVGIPPIKDCMDDYNRGQKYVR